MAGLIPLGGGGPPDPTCFNCGGPAAGPCAMCRTMICASDECSVIVRERGLPEVVLCRDCARYRPVLASSPLTAPLLALAGLVAGAVVALAARSGDLSWPVGLGGLAAAGLLLLSVATAIARWQWRSRLKRARERS